MSDHDPSDQDAFRAASGGMSPPGARRAPRRHEWTRARIDAFLRELAATGSVSRAARSVGLSRQSAYKLRRRLAGEPFAAAWDEAVADSRLAVPRASFARPSRCPLCGGEPRRDLAWEG